MTDHSLTPEQQRELEGLVAELGEQINRTNVDLPRVGAQLRESLSPVGRQISDDEVEVELTIDLSAIVATLRNLPDAAGSDAFIAAYNARR